MHGLTDKKILEPKFYFFIWAMLMILLGATLGSAYLHLGPFNTILNLTISLIKAGLVALFFMHVHYDKPLMKVFAASGVFWLLILLALAMTDYVSRGWLELPGHWPQSQWPKEP